MEIDIRSGTARKVETIIYADIKNGDDGYKLILNNEMSCIETSGGSAIYIDTKEDAENLIKALQKAIELGNWG